MLTKNLNSQKYQELEKIFNDLKLVDSKANNLVQDYPRILEMIREINDPTIETFQKVFAGLLSS